MNWHRENTTGEMRQEEEYIYFLIFTASASFQYTNTATFSEEMQLVELFHMHTHITSQGRTLTFNLFIVGTTSKNIFIYNILSIYLLVFIHLGLNLFSKLGLRRYYIKSIRSKIKIAKSPVYSNKPFHKINEI